MSDAPRCGCGREKVLLRDFGIDVWICPELESEVNALIADHIERGRRFEGQP